MKRNKEYLRELLLELQNAKYGFIIHELILNPSVDEIKLDHHLDLLMDEGLVARKGEHGYRLTPLGHDAAEAIGKSETWEKLKEASPKEAYDVIKNIGSTLVVSALSKLMGWG